ncbi:MAG: DUF4870 domain-containing protein [Clostridia bacterium]|nr:DUF4870 domain-containing protein [Clostridia bacterium]
MLDLHDKEKAIVCIAHLCILINLPGLFLALAIYFMENGKSEFIKKGLEQAIGLQLLVTFFIVVFRTGKLFGLFIYNPSSSMELFASVSLVVYIFLLITAIYAAYKSYKGVEYQYPLIGKIIAKYKRI